MTKCSVVSNQSNDLNQDKITAIPVLYQSYYHVWMLKLIFILFILNILYLILQNEYIVTLANTISIILHGLFTYLHPSYALFMFFIMIVYRRIKNPNDFKFYFAGQLQYK